MGQTNQIQRNSQDQIPSLQQNNSSHYQHFLKRQNNRNKKQYICSTDRPSTAQNQKNQLFLSIQCNGQKTCGLLLSQVIRELQQKGMRNLASIAVGIKSRPQQQKKPKSFLVSSQTVRHINQWLHGREVKNTQNDQNPTTISSKIQKYQQLQQQRSLKFIGRECLDYWLTCFERSVGVLRAFPEVDIVYRTVNQDPRCDSLLQSAAPKNLKELEIIQVIGKGGFSTVHAVRSKRDGRLFAMKSVRKQKVVKYPQQIQRTATQHKIHLLIDHPFLINTYSLFQSTYYFHFLMQFCPGGELFFHLNKHRPFPQSAAKFYFAQILLAIQYLHQNNIVYRDLKPQNILLDIDGHTKLTDFGLSKDNFSRRSRSNSICGSPQYMPPEMLDTREHSRMVDFYALGAFLYQMLYGVPPYYSTQRAELFRNILQGNLIFPNAKQSISGYFKKKHPSIKKSEVSIQAKSLMKQLLNKQANQRLGSVYGVSEVKSHEFCRDINWDLVKRRKYQPPIKPEFTISNFDKEYTQLPARLSLHSNFSQRYRSEKKKLNLEKEYQEVDVEDENECICNPGDPHYINLQSSCIDGRQNNLQDFDKSQEYSPNKIKRQSSPFLNRHHNHNQSTKNQSMMTSYYKKQKLQSRNKSKQPPLAIEKTERQLVSDSKKMIEQEIVMDSHQRQRTISDPLNTSMLQHEIQEAVNRDIGLRNYQKSIDNSKTSRNQNLNSMHNKSFIKSNNIDQDNVKSTTISPCHRDHLKIVTNSSSKMLMSFGSPNLKNMNEKNSIMKQNYNQKQELFSTVQQHSTTLTGGLTAQRQSGMCLSNISSNNHIPQCPQVTTNETEHSSDNGQITLIGQKNICLSFKKHHHHNSKIKNKADHQDSKQYKVASQTDSQVKSSQKISIVTHKPQLAYESLDRSQDQQEKQSMEDFSSQIKLIQQRKDYIRSKAETKDHFSRQGSFQGLELQSTKAFPQAFFTSNNTPISRDANKISNSYNKNIYQKFSDNYCFQAKVKPKKKKGTNAVSSSDKTKLLGSVILPYHKEISVSRKENLKSGNRRLDIHNIVSERKREPLSPQPLPMLGEFEHDLCILQTSLDNNNADEQWSNHATVKYENFQQNNNIDMRNNHHIQNKIINLIVNGQSSHRRQNLDKDARLQQTFQIKGFENVQQTSFNDQHDLKAQQVLIKLNGVYKQPQNHSHELQKYHQLKYNNNSHLSLFQKDRKNLSNKQSIPEYRLNLDKKQEKFKTSMKTSRQKQLRSSSSSSQTHIHMKSAHSISKSIDNNSNSVAISHKATNVPKLSEQQLIENLKMKQLKQGSQTSSNITTPLNKTTKALPVPGQISLQRQKPPTIQQKISNNIAQKIAKSKQNMKPNKNSNKLMNKNQKFVNKHYHNQSGKNPSAQTKSINQSLCLIGQKQRRQKYMDSVETISSFKLGIKSEQTKKERNGWRINQQTPTNNRLNNAIAAGTAAYNTASFKLQSSPPEARFAYSGNPTAKNRSPITRSPIQSTSICTAINSLSRLKSERDYNYAVRQELYAQSYQQKQQQQQQHNKNIKQLLGAQIKRSKYAQKQINKEAKRKNAIAQKILLRQSSSHAIKHYRPQKAQKKEESKLVIKKLSTQEEEQEEVIILKDQIYFPEDTTSIKQTSLKILPQHSGDNTKVNSTQGTNNISSNGSSLVTIDISSAKREHSCASRKGQMKRVNYKQQQQQQQHRRGQMNYSKSKTQYIQEAHLNDQSFDRCYIKEKRNQSSISSSSRSRDISSSRLMKFSKYLTSIPDQ